MVYRAGNVVEDGNAVSSGHAANEEAAAVEVSGLPDTDGFPLDRCALWNLLQGDCELPAGAQAVRDLGDCRDAPRLRVEYEQEDDGRLFCPHVAVFVRRSPFVRRYLRVEPGDVCRTQPRDCDPLAPIGFTGRTAQKDLTERRHSTK